MQLYLGKDKSVLEARFIHETLDESLLKQAMNEIFYPTWPEYDPGNPDNETTLSTDYLVGLVKEPPDSVKPFIMVVGENLDDSAKRNIIGFRYAIYMPNSQTACQIYLAVKPNSRSQGIGRKIADLTQQGLESLAIKRGEKLKGLFFEIHDPEKVTADQDNAMDPQKRKALFEKWGAKEIGADQGVKLDYTVPYFEPGEPQEETYLLMSYPIDGKHATPDITRSFLQSYYGDYAEMSADEIKNNLPYQRMMINLDKIEAENKKSLSFGQSLAHFFGWKASGSDTHAVSDATSKKTFAQRLGLR